MNINTKYHMYMALILPLAYLPMWILYRISDFIFFILRYILKYRQKVIRENLAASFPDTPTHVLRKYEGEFYRQLADDIVETLKLLHISDSTLHKRVKVVNAGLVEEIARTGAPIFLYLGHYCNWEWVPSITLHFSTPRTTSQIYKPLRDKAFDRVMLRIRSRFNALNIPQNQAFRTLYHLKSEGSFICGILDDHSPNHDRSHHYMTFLNHPGTIINVGAEELGNRIGAKFLYLDVEKNSRGHYTLTFKPIDPTDFPGDKYPVSHQYMLMLEATIRRQPPYWLWSHKRWRYTATTQNPNI